jgi:hypothetical protein
MNSLGASGSRGSKHGSGSGSAKHGNEEVYSGVGERPGSEDASKDRTKLKAQSKSKVAKTPGKVSSRDEEVKQAFAAMGRVRVREPFIADESLIAAVNDTTVVPGANSEDDCEITLEELAPKFPTGSQKFGHRGWIAGGEEEGEKEQEGDGAGEDSPVIVSSPEKEEQLQEAKTQGALRKQQTGKSPGKASKQVKSSGGSAGKARKKNPDPFAIESELEDDPVDEGNGSGGDKPPEARSDEEAGAQSSQESGAFQSGGQRGARTAKNPRRKRTDGRKRKQGKQASDEDGDGDEGKSDTEPAASGSAQVKRVVHVPAFDEHVPRSELKMERRAATRQRNDEVRRQAGADKRVQQDFDDVLEEIRMTNPLSVGNTELVCWSKKLALKAREAVHLTAAKMAGSTPIHRFAELYI